MKCLMTINFERTEDDDLIQISRKVLYAQGRHKMQYICNAVKYYESLDHNIMRYTNIITKMLKRTLTLFGCNNIHVFRALLSQSENSLIYKSIKDNIKDTNVSKLLCDFTAEPEIYNKLMSMPADIRLRFLTDAIRAYAVEYDEVTISSVVMSYYIDLYKQINDTQVFLNFIKNFV